jgi:hypothetical protein
MCRGPALVGSAIGTAVTADKKEFAQEVRFRRLGGAERSAVWCRPDRIGELHQHLAHPFGLEAIEGSATIQIAFDFGSHDQCRRMCRRRKERTHGQAPPPLAAPLVDGTLAKHVRLPEADQYHRAPPQALASFRWPSGSGWSGRYDLRRMEASWVSGLRRTVALGRPAISITERDKS